MLYWNGYMGWLLMEVEEGVEDNSPDPAPDQAWRSTCTEITVVEPPDLDKTKKRYPVVIPYVKGASEQVRRVMKGYGLKVYFTPTIMLS